MVVLSHPILNLAIRRHLAVSVAKLTAKHYLSSMPKGPKGEKRPADVVGNAVHVMRIATGEITETDPVPDGKDPFAVALGKRGGQARAKALGKARRAEIARGAAIKRWKNSKI